MRFDPAITITFKTRKVERGLYVQEHFSGVDEFSEHGPMQEADVEPFIQARLAYYHKLVADIKKQMLIKLGILPGDKPAKLAAEPAVQSTPPLGLAEAEARAKASLNEPPRATSASKAWHSIDEQPEPMKLTGASPTKVIIDDPFKKCDCPKETCRDLHNCRHG